MALTNDYKYHDADNDWIEAESVDLDPEYDSNFGAVAFIRTESCGAYVSPEVSLPLALNMLGHDRQKDEPVSTGVFEVGRHKAPLASSKTERDEQIELAAALLTAADVFDRRAIRLATAEERRQWALKSLANSFAKVNKPATEWTGDDVGKLREALGRYDAELAN